MVQFEMESGKKKSFHCIKLNGFVIRNRLQFTMAEAHTDEKLV